MVFIVFCDKGGQSNEPLTIIYCAGIENFSLVCIPISSESRLRPQWSHIYTEKRNLSISTSGDSVTLRIRALAASEDSHGKRLVLATRLDHLIQRAAAHGLAYNTVLGLSRPMLSPVPGIWCGVPLGYAVSNRGNLAVKHRVAVFVQLIDCCWLWWRFHGISFEACCGRLQSSCSLLARRNGDCG